MRTALGAGCVQEDVREVFGRSKFDEEEPTPKELTESVLDLLGKATTVMERLEKVLDRSRTSDDC